ncbi:MAG: hypothetical protein WC551_01700 [Patescibacteria group bacterium]
MDNLVTTTTAVSTVQSGMDYTFFGNVFPILLISGFFVAAGLIISWSSSGLNFDLAIKQKPWRRKVLLGLGIYMVGLSLLRIIDDIVAIAKGFPLSEINPKEIMMLVVFLGVGLAVIGKVYKPTKTSI